MGVYDVGTERYDSMKSADYADIVTEPTPGTQCGVGHVNQENPTGPPGRAPSVHPLPRNGTI